jgi:signal transduction histidine kinase/CheY-like chemotaxis protein
MGVSIVESESLNQQIRLIMDSCPLGITWYNASRIMMDCNAEALRMCGATDKEKFIATVNKDFYTYFPRTQPNGIDTKEQAAWLFNKVETEGRTTIEVMHLDANGDELPTEVTMIRLDNPDRVGDFVFVAYVRDLSETVAEKKKASEANARVAALEVQEIESQAKSEAMELTRILLDNSPVLIELWEENGRKCIGCNRYLLDTFGLADETEFNDNWEDFSAPIQACGTPASELNPYWITKAAKEGSSSGDWLFVLPIGEELPARSTWVKIEHHGRSMIIVYSVDLRPIRAAMQAEESSKAKSSFLARMSHEIRTPLSAVLSISEMQLRNEALPAHTEEAFARIYDSSKTLLHVVNDILDFSKVESGKMTLAEQEYDVASLVSDAAQLHLVYSERKDVVFEMNVDENLPARLLGDVLRIRQIVTNLLTNAFKYTEHGSVTLSLKCEKERGDGEVVLVISIADTGMGMDSAQISELRGEYVRLHEQSRPFVSGTGLGIPIVYSLANLMGAQFDLESEVGKGTKAVIRIPQMLVDTAVLGAELAQSLEKFESRTWSFAKELEFTPEPLPPGDILVVDDVDTNLYIAEAMLQSFGLDPDLCENAQQVLDKIKQGKVYDIIFLDYMMPGMNGVELAKLLRTMGYDHPIVALTANAVKGEAEMFMSNGFSGFMSKPIDIKILHSYLMRYLPKMAA